MFSFLLTYVYIQGMDGDADFSEIEFKILPISKLYQKYYQFHYRISIDFHH